MKINKHRKIFFLILPLILILGIFFLANFSWAEGWATTVVSDILSIFIFAFGLILGLVIRGLIYIASYQHFLDAQAVIIGWAMVRDIANMFFVVILMIIAFGTILHLENYNYKKWLPKLILMAILINFSKTICGLLIDVAQVVMLTFVNAFQAVGGANMTDMLGISKIVTMSNNSAGGGSFTTIVGAYVLGIIYLLVAVVVITTMMVILVMRLVMIWIYVVLSPLAYLLAAFPGGQKYASQWWSEFIKNLVVGPVLAFFIWLSLASLSGINNMTLSQKQISNINGQDTSYTTGVNNAANSGTGSSTSSNAPYAGTQASTPSALIAFVVGIGMLLGGLKISQEIGGAAGGIAGKGMARINKGANFVGNFGKKTVGNFVVGKAQAVGRSARNTALGAVSGLAKGAGYLAAGGKRKKNNKVSDTLKAMGNIGLNWRSDMITANKKRKQSKRQKFLEKVGMGETAMDATSNFLKTDTGKEVSTATTFGTTLAAAGGAIAGPVGAGIGAAVGFVGGGTLSHFTKGSKFQSWTSQTTQKAAANGSKEIANARQNVKSAANNASEFMRDSSGGTFYSNTGGQAKKTIEQLVSKHNPNAQTARNNLRDLINSGTTHNNEHNENFALGLANGLAAFKQGGGDVSSLQEIVQALNQNNGNSADSYGLRGATVDSLEGNVIAYRHSSQNGERGSGELEIDTLANNDKNKVEKNIVGVDFTKLKEQGVKIDSEAFGGNISGNSMKKISDALINEIDNAQSNLQNAKDHGEISDDDFDKRNTNLNKAKEKLTNPEGMKNLSLVNTASRDYGRQERMTTVYHEEMHKGGITDDSLAEGIAKSLMDNKLYGRNAQTGGRHATEIASFAKAMQDNGKGNGEIMTAVNQEIQSRVKTEGKNRADRVINKETGQKESESQATSEEGKPEAPTINTEDLQRKIDELSKKFNDFQLESPALAVSAGGAKAKNGLNASSLRLLFKKIITTNNHLIKRLSTPLEADVLLKNSEKA